MEGNKSNTSNSTITIPSNKSTSPQLSTFISIQNTDNTIGKILTIAGYTIIALGFIGSIILGNTYAYYGFNTAIFLVGTLSSALSGLLVIGLGEIINILHQSRENLRTLIRYSTPKER